MPSDLRSRYRTTQASDGRALRPRGDDLHGEESAPERRGGLTPAQQLAAILAVTPRYWHARLAEDDSDPFVVQGCAYINGDLLIATLSFEPARTRRDRESPEDDHRSLGPGTCDGASTCSRFRLTARVGDRISEDSVPFRESLQRAGASLACARVEFDAETRVLNVRADGRWDPIAAPTRRLVQDVFNDFRRLIERGDLASAVTAAKGRWCLKSERIATGGSGD